MLYGKHNVKRGACGTMIEVERPISISGGFEEGGLDGRPYAGRGLSQGYTLEECPVCGFVRDNVERASTDEILALKNGSVQGGAGAPI